MVKENRSRFLKMYCDLANQVDCAIQSGNYGDLSWVSGVVDQYKSFFETSKFERDIAYTNLFGVLEDRLKSKLEEMN